MLFIEETEAAFFCSLALTLLTFVSTNLFFFLLISAYEIRNKFRNSYIFRVSHIKRYTMCFEGVKKDFLKVFSKYSAVRGTIRHFQLHYLNVDIFQ